MNKGIYRALALLGASAASSAMAQSSVTVYGLVDSGIVYRG